MILFGRYASPYVRRVAATFRLYGIEYEHQPLSVFTNIDEVEAINPLIRVPILIWDDGAKLIESAHILQSLDAHVGAERALWPKDEAAKRHALYITALALGVGDKIVSLTYEKTQHERQTPAWVTRCTRQIHGALNELERDRAARATPYWFGDSVTHADVAATCILTFALHSPTPIDLTPWPALRAHRERCEALPAFRGLDATYAAPMAPR